MKILNLYAGIGGNRRLWGNEDEITAVELDPKIAGIYQDFFPNDKMVIADAHQYLLEHFKEFDFIWSSPPCPSHSAFRKDFSCNVGAKPLYPDMKLYEEILLLDNYFNGKYCVENVISFYPPLIVPTTLQRHYFWTNFNIVNYGMPHFKKDGINLTGGTNDENNDEQIEKLQQRHNINIEKYDLSGITKRTTLRNCVNPELGLHIFNEMKKDKIDLFSKELINEK
jgi:DNA (cytosine-5)-methyltransferase 1